MRALITRCAMVTFALGVLAGCDSRQGLNPGDVAPEFSLTSLSGETHSLSSYRGKVVILNFLASWCQPCIAELPSMQRLSMMDTNVKIIGIGIDDETQALKDIAQRSGVTFPLLVDSSGRVKNTYKIAGVPESFILDKDLRIVLYTSETQGPTVRLAGAHEWDSDPLKSFVLALSSSSSQH